MTKTKPEKDTGAPVPSKSGKNKKWLFIAVLCAVFVVGGLLILRLQSQSKTIPVPMPVVPEKSVPETTQSEVYVPEFLEPEPAMTPIPASVVTDTETAIPTETASEPTEPVAAIEPAPVVEPVIEQPTIEPVPEVLDLHTRLAAGTAKLADLLALRDNFANNNSCVEGYQKLLDLEPRTPLLQNAVDALQPFCTKSEPVLTGVTQTFSKAKKRALMAYYKAKYPKWWFIKAIPVSAIEIRRLNPTNYRPIDYLHRAHNALIRQDIDQSIRFVDNLPPLMRAQMDDFVQVAGIYNRARKTLDSVILSFEKGE